MSKQSSAVMLTVTVSLSTRRIVMGRKMRMGKGMGIGMKMGMRKMGMRKIWMM